MKNKIIFRYIKDHIILAAGAFVSLFLFGIVIYLYHLPVEAVSYGVLLGMAAAVLFIVLDFVRYWKKHRQLCEQRGKVSVDLSGLMEPGNLVEEDYQELLRTLFEEKRRLISQMDVKSEEMADYYTLWAHQIKTPIAAMRVIMDSDPDIAAMKQELFKIECYVEMVLQYLRMESTSSDLKLQKYNLEAMVRQAVKKYAPIFIYKKIRVDLEGLEGSVLTDEKWTVFVLEQLLSNALKYTKSGGCIRLFMDPKKKQTLVIEDTGVGIQKEDLPRIFEKGFTGYNGRMDKKSTGLGLYLCKKILDKLSHEISIFSEEGQGTRVEIDFSHKKLLMD